MATQRSGYDTGGSGGSRSAASILNNGSNRSRGLDRIINGDITRLAQEIADQNISGGGSGGTGSGGYSSGGYSSGGGTGSGGTWNTSGYSTKASGVSKAGTTSETTGDYLTGPGADIFASSPIAMAADILEGLYPNTNQGLGLLEQLRPYSDAANVLFLASQGQDAEGGTKEDWLNWLNDYWNTLMTPGASLGDPAELWANLLNPAQNSPLVSYLAVQDPAQQARNFRGVAAGIAGTMLHPLIADALMDNLNYRQDAFLGEAAKGATDPFYEWVQGVMPFLDRMY